MQCCGCIHNQLWGSLPTFATQVVAVGAGREEDGKTVVPNVAVGSTVLYSKYSGTEFSGEGDKQFIVVKESDILAALS